jgi:hypothetical protein
MAVAVAAILAARFLVATLPLRRVAVAIRSTDAVIVAVGLAGLAFHCGAMFFRSVVQTVPGADRAISQIDALQTISIIWFAVFAALVLLGLRRQHPLALTLSTTALAAVGITMYDEGSLPIHLAAIFVCVVTLAGIAAALILPPHWRNLVDPQH